MSPPWAEGDVDFGRVRVLTGNQGGKYPSGNALLVRGSSETAIIDPSIDVLPRRDEFAGRVDRVIFSHVHEDHIAGAHVFPDVPWHAHEADVPGLRSIDEMMQIYGFPEPIHSGFQKIVEERFHYMPRPDAGSFADGHCFELGGVRVKVIHTPGHTRGHCALLVEPEGVLYLGDMDLSSFGPYYGDAWSDLEDFERSLARVREIDVPYYATFHHVGVLAGREAFLERLDRFVAVIRSREERLLEYVAEPRMLDDIARHRFVYRPKDAIEFAEVVERRSMSQHLARLERRGRVRLVDEGRWVAVGT